MILRGGYGSGKSILAQVKFKEMVNRGNKFDHLYFIVFSNDTPYTSIVRSYIYSSLPAHMCKEQICIMNFDEYQVMYEGRRQKWQGTVSNVLNDLNKRHGNQGVRVTVVIDELDGSILT